MNRVVHFEIQVDEPERAINFYQKIFDWEISAWPGMENYWMIMTAPEDSKETGINGGMLLRPARGPMKENGANAYVCTVEVKDFDKTARKIEDQGGLVAMPKYAIEGIAWQGYFIDTEGNIFGIHQSDKNAHEEKEK